MNDFRLRLSIALFLTSCPLALLSATRDYPVSPELDRLGQEGVATIRKMIFTWTPQIRPVPGTSTPSWERGLSLAGREDLFAVQRWEPLPTCSALSADPVALITERARHTNIVIINEHHDSSLDRQFIGKVLSALRRVGYRYYAAETFDPSATLVHERTLGSDGTYSNEPVFGRLVGLAKSLGYQLIAYERTLEQDSALAREHPDLSTGDRREQIQAENLMERVFGARPDAKLVIHVGHGHVRERGPAAPYAVPMAQILKRRAGRDPLTISQTDCKSSGSGDVIGEVSGNTTTDGSVDLFVGHPTLTFRGQRPTWRQETGDRLVEIPAQFREFHERVIVEARPAEEGLGTVPADRVLLYPGERVPLLLSAGKYRLDAFLESGRIQNAEVSVTVR